MEKGYSVDYLLGPVSGGREGYYTGAVACGEPAGVWYGTGAAMLGLAGEVDAAVMEAVYAHGMDPRDEKSKDRSTWGEAPLLGSAQRNYQNENEILDEMLSREPNPTPERRAELRREAENRARQNVAFYDATFSPGKDVTVTCVAFERLANDARAAAARAEAAGDLATAWVSRDEAQAWARMQKAVEDAVMAGARASIDHLEDVAGYSRVGRHGGGAGRWADAHTFVVAQFLQHDSRDGDPQLHVHQAILNRVQCPDGSWRTIEGRNLFGNKKAAGAHGERVMEACLSRWLGLRFETRADGKARQIVGVPQDVMDLFSKRRRAVSDRTEKLIAQYREHNGGREPSALERYHIAQRATLETRKGKSQGGESLDERLDRWTRESENVLVGGLAKVARSVLAQSRSDSRNETPAEWDPENVITRALAGLEKRASWSRSDLTHELDKALPANLGQSPEKLHTLLETLTDVALERTLPTKQRESADHLAPEFRLADGRSAYQMPGSERYTLPSQLRADRYLTGVGVVRGAEKITMKQAKAVANRYAANGKELGADQRAALLGVLTSGARVETLVAAAGAGKTFAVGAIREAWGEHGHRTLGLTPSQVAAKELIKEGVAATNLTAWRNAQQRLDEGRGKASDEAYRIVKGDLIVVDEAGMADSRDLAAVIERAEREGAKVLLVGDHRQLAAVGPGGALADIGEKALSYELTEVRRFNQPWEREASLRLRDADSGALEQYDKHGRIRAGGTPEQAAQLAAEAWLSDRVAGKDSLLLVSSNEQASQMSALMRAELVRLGRVQEHGVELGRDGTTAGVGDEVQARRNGWELIGQHGNARAPINRETYRVVGTHDDGSMTVRDEAGYQIRLSADYVRADVALAYASTVHAAQGRTVDTCHGVVASNSDAASVYVQLTRGRDENTAWVVTQPTPSEAPVAEAQNVKEISARSVVAGVLERSEQDRSALSEQLQDDEDRHSTYRSLDRLCDGIAHVTQGRTSGLLDRMVADGTLSQEDREALAADTSMRAVDRLLRSAEVSGQNPAAVLRQALDNQPLTGTRSPAQALHARIQNNLDQPGSGTIESYRDLIPEGVSGKFREQLEKFADDADSRRHELGTRIADQPPAWATEALGPVPSDPLERLEWEQKAGWAAAYRENMEVDDDSRALGPAPALGLAEKRSVWWTAHEKLGITDVPPEEDSLSDGALRARVAAYEREEAWAPPYVAEQLAATAEAAADKRRDADRWAARAEASDDDELKAEAEQARLEAERLEARREKLELADRERARWFTENAETRNRSDRAKATLDSRGLEVEDPDRKVTADQWVDAHQEEQRVEEPHRRVTERDVDDVAEERDELVTADSVDGPALETDVPDIRETSTVHPSEHEDAPREVPDEETTEEAVDRALDSLTEIQNRRQTDAAHDDEHGDEHMEWWAAVDEDLVDDADADDLVR